MDRHTLCIPSDFRSLGAFRHLSLELGNDPLRAAGLVCHLFGDLAYAAERSPLGFMSENNARLFRAMFPSEKDPVELLASEPGFLVKVDGGWHCPVFAEKNKHWNPLCMSIQEMGGQVTGMKKLEKRLLKQAGMQDLLGLDPVCFQHADGRMMESAEARRTELLIRNADACFGRRVRTKSEFTPTLIQNAWRALHDFSEEDVNRVLVTVRKHAATNHPALPKSTEEMLENFNLYAV